MRDPSALQGRAARDGPSAPPARVAFGTRRSRPVSCPESLNQPCWKRSLRSNPTFPAPRVSVRAPRSWFAFRGWESERSTSAFQPHFQPSALLLCSFLRLLPGSFWCSNASPRCFGVRRLRTPPRPQVRTALGCRGDTGEGEPFLRLPEN